jgi:hypothetical protein
LIVFQIGRHEYLYSMKPYLYKLTGKDNTYYYGVRWDYKGNPEDDLLKTYFTSSDHVKQIISEKGINFFTGEIIEITETREEVLDLEYFLIKESINDNLCLNRALGKCTIWNDDLLTKLSLSMKEKWEDDEYRRKSVLSRTGVNNHNYKKPSWRNVNSDIKSWMKSFTIYDDFINEKWDFSKYGYGRFMLQKKYDISHGTARCIIKKLKNNWSPYKDEDFLKFYNENL